MQKDVEKNSKKYYDYFKPWFVLIKYQKPIYFTIGNRKTFTIALSVSNKCHCIGNLFYVILIITMEMFIFFSLEKRAIVIFHLCRWHEILENIILSSTNMNKSVVMETRLILLKKISIMRYHVSCEIKTVKNVTKGNSFTFTYLIYRYFIIKINTWTPARMYYTVNILICLSFIFSFCMIKKFFFFGDLW